MKEQPHRDTELDSIVNEITDLAKSVIADRAYVAQAKSRFEEQLRPSTLSPEEITGQVDATLEQYKKTPAFVVSTSPAKISLLEEAGIFGAVQPLRNSVDHEKLDHREFLAQPPHPMFDQKTETTMVVAKGKLLDALAEHTIPPDAFVLAADTMPQFFPETDPSGMHDHFPHTAISLERPESINHARDTMRYVFESIVRQYVHFHFMTHIQRQVMTERDKPPEKIERAINFWHGAIFGMAVNINTGFAIRFPNKTGVETFDSSLQMHPTILHAHAKAILGDRYDMSSKKLDNDTVQQAHDFIERLIDDIITIQGDTTIKVSGGIDYTNPAVRTVLGAKFMENFEWIPDDQLDISLFQGMSPRAIKEYLRTRAEEDIKKSTR